jgi:ferrochelatase
MTHAIILFNLGGPDTKEAVQPFLYNLFSDAAIIRVPQPFRWLIAKLISSRRAAKAKGIYAHMGGGSPILPNTEAQAKALEVALGPDYKCFTVMRYWHPRAKEVVKALTAYAPDKLVFLPLYPQFSSTTTASSIDEFAKALASKLGHTIVDYNGPMAARGISAWNAKSVCCYPTQTGFITALAELISPRLLEAAQYGPPRLLLSAHGLPEKVIKQGDPYQWQCEQTTKALLEKLTTMGHRNLDAVLCYQSRVGPLKWIGPATEDEIIRAGTDKTPLVIAPIAFVSEHSETLVELDIEYKEVAHHTGVPFYARVPTVSTHPAFIAGLADLVRNVSSPRTRLCPPEFGDCPCRTKS